MGGGPKWGGYRAGTELGSRMREFGVGRGWKAGHACEPLGACDRLSASLFQSWGLGAQQEGQPLSRFPWGQLERLSNVEVLPDWLVNSCQPTTPSSSRLPGPTPAQLLRS